MISATRDDLARGNALSTWLPSGRVMVTRKTVGPVIAKSALCVSAFMDMPQIAEKIPHSMAGWSVTTARRSPLRGPSAETLQSSEETTRT